MGTVQPAWSGTYMLPESDPYYADTAHSCQPLTTGRRGTIILDDLLLVVVVDHDLAEMRNIWLIGDQTIRLLSVSTGTQALYVLLMNSRGNPQTVLHYVTLRCTRRASQTCTRKCSGKNSR